MKRLAICLLALLLVFPSMSALAGDYLGAMCVVNCEEWVSLRLLPDAQSDVAAPNRSFRVLISFNAIQIMKHSMTIMRTLCIWLVGAYGIF